MNEQSRFRTIVSWLLALALAGIFVVSGAWKLYAPAQAGIRQVETGVPSAYGLPFAVLLGSLEVFAALLLLVPAWRRAGAALTGAMLVTFMAYMGARYSQLKGVECGCMPGHQRALGAGFFIEDGLMLAAAVLVFVLARAAVRRRVSLLKPAVAFLVILAIGIGSATLERRVFAGNSAMMLKVMDRSGQVAGMSVSPRSRTLLYFLSQSCMDCQHASEQIAHLRLAAPLIVLPDSRPETAYDYLKKAGIKNAVVSLDYPTLALQLHIKQVPALYVFQGGKPEAVILDFDQPALDKALRAQQLLD